MASNSVVKIIESCSSFLASVTIFPALIYGFSILFLTGSQRWRYGIKFTASTVQLEDCQVITSRQKFPFPLIWTPLSCQIVKIAQHLVIFLLKISWWIFFWKVKLSQMGISLSVLIWTPSCLLIKIAQHLAIFFSKYIISWFNIFVWKSYSYYKLVLFQLLNI